jgi:acylphosphatase
MLEPEVHAAPPIARRALARGRVQGVFYRASAEAEARRLGLAGWVRNLPDGGVEAHLQGPPAAVETMLAWMRRGPPLARVDTVEVEVRELDARYQRFEVRR